MAKYIYGWRKPTNPSPHPRYLLPRHHHQLPENASLRFLMPPVYDQGQLGSCTANAIVALIHFLLLRSRPVVKMPSRLMLYFGERLMEGSTGIDAGADGNDGFIFAADKGVCSEDTWPYDISKFAVMPPASAWAEATTCKLTNVVQLSDGDIHGIKSCIASGYPVAFGFIVYPGWETDETEKTGVIPMPLAGEQSLGGHEVLIVGYDDKTQYFEVRNSYGDQWGNGGYCWMPYAYISNTVLASTFRSAKGVN